MEEWREEEMDFNSLGIVVPVERLEDDQVSSGWLDTTGLEEVCYEEGDAKEQYCSICLEKFVVGSSVVRLPCSHMYHLRCVSRWLERKDACSLCRMPSSVSPYFGFEFELPRS